jgi:hypothetical protein
MREDVIGFAHADPLSTLHAEVQPKEYEWLLVPLRRRSSITRMVVRLPDSLDGQHPRVALDERAEMRSNGAVRIGLLLLLLSAGCYSPRLASPGFHCHADDEPSCPEGQVCVNARCQNKSGGTTKLDGSVPRDMATTGGDMGAPRDMSMLVGPTGCNGYVQCLIACGADDVCATGCDGNVTTGGMDKYQIALSCGQNWCLNTFPKECTINAAMTMLVDAAGRPAGSCSACLQNSLAQLFGDVCSPTTSPNCNPASCKPDYAACMSDTP